MLLELLKVVGQGLWFVLLFLVGLALMMGWLYAWIGMFFSWLF